MERLVFIQPPGCSEIHGAPFLSAAGPVLPAECLLDRGPRRTARGRFETHRRHVEQGASSSAWANGGVGSKVSSALGDSPRWCDVGRGDSGIRPATGE